ncbi:MAG TPA: deoxyguanosinetriphosphate triphosphohydrolase [Hyphomicrobiaceae bacterium]|nr:deoxyguanosinetriphosphate triphosphohydrolase [Hyphomicrobiaceae bacterium]
MAIGSQTPSPARDVQPRRLRALAAYAAVAEASAGRLHSEPACPMRTPFQRDRDRIVHATAFRRLTYKTQVFVFHEGDHYRTRLTHSLEVAQIARAMARMLELDEDLAEALALAHDLGHPPFGHAGERALAAATASFGGFDHNAQSLRVVTRLERKYASFDGLNLSYETLEGLAKHNGPLLRRGPISVLQREIEATGLSQWLHLEQYAPAEAQVAALADDIAYNAHDLDDGLRAGLIGLGDLAAVPLAAGFAAALPRGLDKQRAIYEVNRRIISALIEDALRESRERLARLADWSVAGVRAASMPVIAHSEERAIEAQGLKNFLFANVYRHPRVMVVMADAERVVRDLFERYMADPGELPGSWRAAAEADGPSGRAAVVADFVAGMTDRYALGEHRRLFDATPDLR